MADQKDDKKTETAEQVKVVTLVSPEGHEYKTSTKAEINQLTRTAGYKVKGSRG